MTDVTLAPPRTDTGPIAWARRRFLSSWFDGLVTLAFGALVVWVAVRVVDWAIVDAVWSVEDRDRCRDVSGACWSVIEARGRLILFGLYPHDQHWRSTLACLAIVLTMGLSCVPWFWGLKRLPALWLAGFGTFMLLMYGGLFGLGVVTYLFCLPFAIYLIIEIINPSLLVLEGWKPKVSLIWILLIMFLTGFAMGKNNDLFINCEDFTLAGDTPPANCRPD